MPRRDIAFLPGHYYHLYNRGANRETLFLNDANFILSLRLLKRYSRRFNITVIAYCHMPNHYHWLVRQDSEIPISVLMQRVWKAYSMTVHKTVGHTGTLFEGRYHAIAVDNDDYLRQLCRYIHANPVHHGMRSGPAGWAYSNYLDWIGKRPGTMLDRAFIERLFGTADDYAATMNEYLLTFDNLPPWLRQHLQNFR